MAAPELRVFIHRDGHYIGANAHALKLLGYSWDDMAALQLGTLSGQEPDAALAMWRRFVEGDIAFAPDRDGLLVTKARVQLAVVTLGVEAIADDVYMARFRLVASGGDINVGCP